MITPLDSRVLDVNSEALGIPFSVLMDNAGKAVADYITGHYPGKKILFVCGPGNNGGDGFATALRLDPENVTVALLKPADRIHSEIAKERFSKLQCKVENYSAELLEKADLIVDCALGTGLVATKIKEPYRSYILAANASGKPILSVDMPSGLGSNVFIVPTCTITFHDVKTGMNELTCGDILVADVGIPIDAMKFTGPGDLIRYPIPNEDSHKGYNGRLMVISGGPYFGAPAMCTKAAFRVGADIVRLYTPEKCAEIVAGFCPELMITYLPGDHLDRTSVEFLLEESKKYTAVLIGPGLGASEDTLEAIRMFCYACETPMIIDADAIKAIHGLQFTTPTVITPHLGELRRLDDGCNSRETIAKEYNATILIKQRVDTITDGYATRFNKTGNAAMTGAGTGDVLAGVVAGLMSKGLPPMDAAALGAYLCGKAGEYAFKDKSYGLMATDVIEEIPHVLRDNLR